MKFFTGCVALAVTVAIGASSPVMAQGIGGFFKRIATGITANLLQRSGLTRMGASIG